MPTPFPVALTADFYDSQGNTKYRDIGLGTFAGQSHISIRAFEKHSPEILPSQLDGARGVIVLTPKVTAKSLENSADLLAVGRFGVGYDSVDVHACTARDVLLFITAGAVNRPVAEATVAWMLALTHHVRTKDRLVRTGQWDERSRYMGSELRERTLGVIGLGGIARAVIDLLRGWGMNPPLAFDPFAKPADAASAGVTLVDLPTLLAQSDFVSIHCPLTEQTRNLIGAPQLALMKPTAYLLNTARGGIVVEDALFDALKSNRLAGAALDCFDVEPVTSPHRFGELENVILAPHSIAWTNELFRDIGRAACQGMIDLSLGKTPHGVVNRDVLAKDSFQKKWRRLCGF